MTLPLAQMPPKPLFAHKRYMLASPSLERSKRHAGMFESPYEWLMKEPQSFVLAARQGVLQGLIMKMPFKDKHGSKYTKADCLHISKHFRTKSEWRLFHHRSFYVAKKLGIIDQCSKNMSEPSKAKLVGTETQCRDKDFCIESALRYQSPAEWEMNAPSAFRTSIKEGWFHECSGHMNTCPKSWSVKSALEMCLYFGCTKEWRLKEPNSHFAAEMLGWMDYCMIKLDEGRSESERTHKENTFHLECWINKRK
ncbi:hypothetical protein [Vibrio sp. D431a]|uniref:hypothetical protein n=1 Tax=Vibrio sp. D431a TaxID=2837388 RepID=UPI00255358FB|nr:hypothetical protein [Vibrio sp. D431a]MDK9789898.1 hypothetical protein [Vibrio sp. D431a]